MPSLPEELENAARKRAAKTSKSTSKAGGGLILQKKKSVGGGVTSGAKKRVSKKTKGEELIDRVMSDVVPDTVVVSPSHRNSYHSPAQKYTTRSSGEVDSEDAIKRGVEHVASTRDNNSEQQVPSSGTDNERVEVAELKRELVTEFRREAHQFYRDKSLSRKHIVQAVACLTILVSVGVYISPKTKAESAVFYPESCLGGWINASRAIGMPETESNEFPRAFNADNSALLEAGTGADIYCGNFKGEFDKNTKPTKIIVSLSWSKAEVIATTAEIVGGSFASSSLEILDANASTSVTFTLATSTQVEQVLPLLDATTTESVVEGAASTTPVMTLPEVAPVVATSTPDTPLVSSSTAVIIESGNTATTSESLPRPEGVSEPAPQAVSSSQQETPPVQSLEAPPAPAEAVPLIESPLSFIRRVGTIVAMSFGKSAYADEVASSESAPLAAPEAQAPSAEAAIAPQAPLAEASIAPQAPSPANLPMAGVSDASQPAVAPIEQSVVPSVVPGDVPSEVSLLSMATSSEVVASTSPLAPINDVVGNSASTSVGILGGIETALDAVQQAITDSVQLPNISKAETSTTTGSLVIVRTELFKGVIPSALERGVDLGLSSSSPVFSSETVFIDDEEVAAVYASSSLAQAVQLEANGEDDSQSNFLQITYTYDGVTWMNLARVNEDSIKYRTFEIPVTATTSWADLSSLQIKVTPIPRIEQTPAIYLDAMKVEVLYETPGEPHAHPDFARDAVIKDKSDDNVRVVNIINSDTNNREIWYTTIRGQGEFGVAPGSWVKLDLGSDVSSYRLVEIYGRYLFWIDEVAKMFWTTNLEKGSNEGTQINLESTTTIPFIKNNNENWTLEYNYKNRKGSIHITE